jgi:hypothetical protein
MNGRVRPITSRTTTTTWRLPVRSSASLRSTRSAFFVFLFDLSAEIGAIDFDRAGKFGLVGVVYLRAHRLVELMREDESRFVLNVEISTERESADALDVVAKIATAAR